MPIRDGEDALKVNWFEITVASPSGRRRYSSAFATDLEVCRDAVEDLARCAGEVEGREKCLRDPERQLLPGAQLRPRQGCARRPAGDRQHNLPPP
ncbi:MAG: hypothetical protein OXC26_17325 [Albidovulum sp.]|nr:hypothetical protein [Albidovulum sp.]